MFRRMTIALILALTLLALGSALADPVLSRSGLTAWIGESNHMYMVDAAGTVKHLPAEILDLISMDSKTIYCLTADHRVFSVYTDGSGSSIVYRNPTEEQLRSLEGERSWQLEEGRLTVTDAAARVSEISAAAVTAVENGGMLYYVEQSGTACLLKRTPLDTADTLPGLSVFPSEVAVTRPISLMASGEALTLTHEGGAVTLVSIATGESQTVPAVSADTKAAALVDGTLYRYTADTDGFRLQQADPVTFQVKMDAVTATPAPTATPTRVPPTATPRPTATPTRQPSPTETPEDENIRRGESSSRVRKMQKRLQELGYPVGSVDGTYGRQTQMAVALFQSAVKATERNYVTPKLLRQMNADSAPVYDQFMALQKGDKGMAVRLMQQALISLGYQLGTADGVYGKKTVEAVAAYMRNIGWQVPPTMVMGETAPRELLINLYLYPNTPVGPITPTAQPNIVDQIANDLEQMLNPLD